MIPKIIHYCWIGGTILPEEFQKYIEGWKKNCPDYEIIKWNETNFDIPSNQYAREAYEAKKWAFVADYMRLYILYNYGGIYLDTDMELLKNIDCFLENNAFVGFESDVLLSAGIIGCEKGNKWIGHILAEYKNRSFYLKNGEEDLSTLPGLFTKITARLSPELKLDNTKQTLSCNLTVYPSDFFYPEDGHKSGILITNNTYAHHHFAASWINGTALQIRSYQCNLFRKYTSIKNIYHKNNIYHANSCHILTRKLLFIIYELIYLWIVYRSTGIKNLGKVTKDEIKKIIKGLRS